MKKKNSYVYFIGREIDTKTERLGGPQRAAKEIQKIDLSSHSICKHFNSKYDFNLILWDIIVKRKEVSCLHISDANAWSSLIGILAALLLMPVSVTVQGHISSEVMVKEKGNIWSGYLQDVLIYLSRRTTTVFAPSEWPKYFGHLASEKNVVCIPNGCSLINDDNNLHINIPNKEPKSKVNITTVGGTRTVKGMSFLINNLDYLSRNNEGFNLSLHLFGGKGENHDRLMKLPDKLDISYHGFIPQKELFKFYSQRTDLYIQSSRYEPFGMAPLEALCCGVPIFVTKRCGLVHYFGNNIYETDSLSGIFEYGSSDSFNRVIRGALSMVYSSSTSYEKGRARVSKQKLSVFKWKNIYKKYTRVWRNI
jgi:glycosyltransferase involved in cell wall biosynthesis